MPKAQLKALAERFGAHVADTPVCRGHHAPLDFLASWCYDRPPVSLLLGPRGGGKSFLTAFETHLDSLKYNHHGTKILGGSLSQSQQIYEALKSFDRVEGAPPVFKSFNKTNAEYVTGSTVSMLAASQTSVRGPHVASLKLDEIDEIDPEIREASLGICMERHGVSAQVAMTSTWHRVGGPMGELVEQGQSGAFPFWQFCAFEVLERCPESRSGKRIDTPDLYENCPQCPLQPFCHAETAMVDGKPEPKAKRSSGHYAIDSLTQKITAVSRRVFEADYLCLGPKADGIWFRGFDPTIHTSDQAEYQPGFPVHLAIDIGVHTGAVFFQVVERDGAPVVHVFADYYAEGESAYGNARKLLLMSESICNGLLDKVTCDPAAEARTPVGVTVLGEYKRAGLRLNPWPLRKVADGLELVESFLSPADGQPRLLIHPRCEDLIRAMRAYRRKKRQNQWIDEPEDPQHPHEDLVDPLRGGLCAQFPEGRTPPPKMARRPARRAI